jgi:GWxTD domain-containing protein
MGRLAIKEIFPMPIRLPSITTMALLLIGMVPATAAKLDDDDKEWLRTVAPIILAEEEETYKELEDKADRMAFREIFWARRDADLKEPGNPFKEEFEAARERANRDYRVSARPGAMTDCGRVRILLGEPDDIRQQNSSGLGRGLRVPEMWVYRDKPGQTFEGGEALISFDEECRAPSTINAALEKIAASKIVQPQLTYRKGDDGKLVTLEEQLPRESTARALLSSPREDFPLDIDTSFLRVSDDTTGVMGLVRGKAPGVQAETREGREVIDVVVATSVLDPDGAEMGWTEQPVAAAVQPDGSFIASYGMAFPPGEYTLNVGVVVGDLASLVSKPVEVPDFSKVETAPDGTETLLPSVASILFVREVEELPANTKPDPKLAYAAFRLGPMQLIPYFGRELEQSDTVSFFYLIYNLEEDPSTQKADAVVAFSILKNGRTPVAQAPENPVTTPMAASAIGPVPLGAYPPGDYVVQLRVTDHLSKKTVVKNEHFSIVGAEAGEAPASPDAPAAQTP